MITFFLFFFSHIYTALFSLKIHAIYTFFIHPLSSSLSPTDRLTFGAVNSGFSLSVIRYLQHFPLLIHVQF